MKKIFPVLWASFIIFLLVIAGTASAIKPEYKQELSKSGNPGSRVVYTIDIKNDHDYPVDIKAKIINSDWNASIKKAEFHNVMRNKIVRFRFFVDIPKNPDSNQSLTTINLYERPSMGGVNDYSRQFHINLTTSIKEKNSATPAEILMEQTGLLFLFAIMSLIFGYFWRARHYYLLGTPLYSRIMDNRILDKESRKKIFDFLQGNNGSTLKEISEGTQINYWNARSDMEHLLKHNFVLKKDRRYFVKSEGSFVFDTSILSPVYQRLIEIIEENGRTTMKELQKQTGRSRPWLGKKMKELMEWDLIQIDQIGKFRYVSLKGREPGSLPKPPAARQKHEIPGHDIDDLNDDDVEWLDRPDPNIG